MARPVDHQASFATAEAREAFAAEAAAQGFEPVERRDDAPPPSPFSIDLRRDDPVTLRHLHGVTWALCELAARHGGSYDGWEPAGVVTQARPRPEAGAFTPSRDPPPPGRRRRPPRGRAPAAARSARPAPGRG